MSSIEEIEKEYDIEITRLLELEEQEYDKLKGIRLEIEKKSKYWKKFIRKICIEK